MVFGGVLFGPVVGSIGGPWPPIDAELFLTFSVPQPMKTHVHGFGRLWLNFVGHHSICRGVVCLNRCWGLWVPHFFQQCSLGDSVFGVDKQSAKFGLCCRGHDRFKDLRYVEHRAVVCRDGGIEGEEVMSANSTHRVGFIEIGGVAMDGEHHVAGSVCEHGLLLCSRIIQELLAFLHGVLCWV